MHGSGCLYSARREGKKQKREQTASRSLGSSVYTPDSFLGCISLLGSHFVFILASMIKDLEISE